MLEASNALDTIFNFFLYYLNILLYLKDVKILKMKQWVISRKPTGF